MSDTSKVILNSIQKGQSYYSVKNQQTTPKVQKTSWNNYVRDNYKHAVKSPGHPMTTLSREYNNLNK